MVRSNYFQNHGSKVTFFYLLKILVMLNDIKYLWKIKTPPNQNNVYAYSTRSHLYLQQFNKILANIENQE